MSLLMAMIAGTMHVEDGLRKLRQMENTTGIWTMRCLLMVERRFIVIQDKNSGVSIMVLLMAIVIPMNANTDVFKKNLQNKILLIPAEYQSGLTLPWIVCIISAYFCTIFIFSGGAGEISGPFCSGTYCYI